VRLDRMRRYAMLIFSVVVLLYTAMPAQMVAQESNGASITGTVTDSSSRAVQAAAVILKSHASGSTLHSTTDDQGHFAFTGLAADSYDLTITATGFGTTVESNLNLSVGQAQNVPVQLKISSLEQNVEVEATTVDSIAAQHALSQGSLDTVDPKSEISGEFIRNFTPTATDYSEIINIAPGTISYNSNGVGLGQGTIYFRGFQDGDFNITWDGIPFNDSNNPTHHSWAFFPGLWVGSVDFDRSPGTASTVGQATYGGSINLLSPQVPMEQSVQPQVSYG
jgi:iron complex outermembrane receptor protein